MRNNVGTTTEKLRFLRLRLLSQAQGALRLALEGLELQGAVLAEATGEDEVEVLQSAGDEGNFAPGSHPPSLAALYERLRPRTALWSRDLAGESWADAQFPPAVRACVALPLNLEPQRYLVLLFDPKPRKRGFSDADERLVEMLRVSLHAILDRLRVDEELQRSEERFRRFFHLSQVGTAMVLPDGGWDIVNEVLVRMFGLTRAELAQHTYFGLTHPDHLGEEQALFQKVVSGELEGYQVEKLFLIPGKGEVPVKVATRALRRSDGQLDRMIALLEDVSGQRLAAREQQQLHLQLLQAQKLESLGVMAGGVAHDFNNLLTGVIGNAHLLAMELGVGPGHPAQGCLSSLLGAAQRAAALTQQLLAYSGQGTLSPAPLELSRLVQEMSELLDSLTPKKVALRLDLGVSLAPAQADASQVQQVVMNLVLNAAEACGEKGGTVWIRTGAEFLDPFGAAASWVLPPPCEGSYCWLEINDTGVGMDAATLRRVFDPFFTTKTSGRGLGLATTLGIARRHGGALTVVSSPGRGSVFRVFFPSVGSAVRSAEESQRLERPAGPARRPQVLIVDDAEVVRTYCRSALERGGFDVAVAASGQEGVATLRRLKGSVDMIVLDMTMPDMDGLETHARMTEVSDRVPVLFMSGNAEVEMRKRLSGVRHVGFIAKPFLPDDLVSAVRRVTGGGKLKEEV
ncbi:MAG: response regulator [Planctomycetota bacterium]